MPGIDKPPSLVSVFTVRLYGAFTKVEEQADGTLVVEGVASSEAVDCQGEVVLAEAMKAAIPEYMKFPAVREMHDAWAAGKTLAAEVRDDKKTYISTKIVDAEACKKVREGVYAGFSIGGKATKRVGKVIEGLSLTEISLVDRPANPDATFQLVKLDGGTMPKQIEIPAVADVTKTDGPDAADVTKTAEPVAAVVTATEPAAVVEKGMEAAWDAAQAIDAILSLQSLLSLEQGEEHAEAAAQVAMLETAIAALKRFVASEISETDPADVAMAAKVGKAVAALEGMKASPIAKKGAKFSKTTKAALNAHHDALGKAAALVGECHKAFKDTMQEALAQEDDPDAEKDDGSGDVADAAKTGDLAKVAGDLEIEKAARAAAEDATAQAGEALKKVMGERDTLASDLAKANAELFRRPKGALLAIEKGADGVVKAEDPPLPANATPEQRAAAEVKKVHRSGGTLIHRL